MTTRAFGKDQWVALFREIGLTDAQMQRWHAEFERRHPSEHESFLAWLGIGAAEIAKIRAGHGAQQG